MTTTLAAHTRTTAFRRLALLGSLFASAALLSACYVVPMQPTAGAPVQSPSSAMQSTQPSMMPPPSDPIITFNARMYPANDLAAKYGMVSGTVSNDTHGRGIFSTVIQGESYTGEATRSAGSNRDGVANGAGNKGGWIRCSYRMNSSTLGTGQCELHNGARFTMHLGG